MLHKQADNTDPSLGGVMSSSSGIPEFNHSRPTGTEGALEWLVGEDFLPTKTGHTGLLWQALESKGVTVGGVLRHEGYDTLRHIILPDGWSKRRGSDDSTMHIFDGDNWQLKVTFFNRPNKLVPSLTTPISRYDALVRSHPTEPDGPDEVLGAAVDYWGVREKGAAYRVLFEAWVNCAEGYDQRALATEWLDKKYPDWRYPLLTWETPTTRLQRWAYRKNCRQHREVW